VIIEPLAPLGKGDLKVLMVRFYNLRCHQIFKQSVKMI